MEMKRSFSKNSFVKAVQTLVPEIEKADLTPATPGVRATCVDPDGNIVDDFHFVSDERQLHVLSAPSPAATASLTLGEEIAKTAAEQISRITIT